MLAYLFVCILPRPPCTPEHHEENFLVPVDDLQNSGTQETRRKEKNETGYNVFNTVRLHAKWRRQKKGEKGNIKKKNETDDS